jgi:hypothetical protein
MPSPMALDGLRACCRNVSRSSRASGAAAGVCGSAEPPGAKDTGRLRRGPLNLCAEPNGKVHY